jgi:hypothetical protein
MDLKDRDQLSQESLLAENYTPRTPMTATVFTRHAVFIHSIILLLYTILFLTAWYFHGKVSPPALQSTVDIYCLYSFIPMLNAGLFADHFTAPAAGAVEFVRVLADVDAPNIYKGNPSKELDDAWEDLLKGVLWHARLSRSSNADLELQDIIFEYLLRSCSEWDDNLSHLLMDQEIIGESWILFIIFIAW